MRVSKKRWGEVTIKKQGGTKNQFDGSKSFSIDHCPFDYDIEELRQILETVVNLTETHDFKTLRGILNRIEVRK